MTTITRTRGADPALRFWPKVRVAGDCWEWTGTKNHCGYGRFWLDGRRVLPHRWAYEQLVAEIPAAFEVDHLCFNRACVNPDHLEAVPPLLNKLRRKTGTVSQRPTPPPPRDRELCVRGHRYTVDNTRIRTNGSRACRICTRALKNEARRRARLAN